MIYKNVYRKSVVRRIEKSMVSRLPGRKSVILRCRGQLRFRLAGRKSVVRRIEKQMVSRLPGRKSVVGRCGGQLRFRLAGRKSVVSRVGRQAQIQRFDSRGLPI